MFALIPSSQDVMHMLFGKEWDDGWNKTAFLRDVLFSSTAFAELALDPGTEKLLREAGAGRTDDGMITILLNEAKGFRESLKQNVNDYTQLCNIAIHVHGKFNDQISYPKDIVTGTVVPGDFVKKVREKLGQKTNVPIDPTGKSVSVTYSFTDETEKNQNKPAKPQVQADVSLLFLTFAQGKFKSVTHQFTIVPKEIPEILKEPIQWTLKKRP
jgi:hypothetical protein